MGVRCRWVVGNPDLTAVTYIRSPATSEPCLKIMQRVLFRYNSGAMLPPATIVLVIQRCAFQSVSRYHEAREADGGREN